MVALGLTLFAFSILVAVLLGWKAANQSKKWDESKHLNLVQSMSLNGNGKK